MVEPRRRGWSGKGTVLVLVAALVVAAALLPALLHRPLWVEVETVLGVWWAIWVGVVGYIAHSGQPLHNDYAPRVQPKVGSRTSWLGDVDFGWLDTSGSSDDLVGGCLGLVAALVAIVAVVFLAMVLVDLVVPLLVAAIYMLGIALLRRALRGAGGAAGRPLAALGFGVWWATVYTAPLALLVLLAHRMG